jgi:two-component system, chemotaxis family, protein-glutamate methylesterase/glutaminase
MTGMGKDGVEGIKEIKHAGGQTIAQDKESSVIFGMNKIAIESGAVDNIVSLNKIAHEIINIAR